MILNYIWIGFFVIGFIVALIRVLGYVFRDFFLNQFNIVFDLADRDVFTAIVNSTFDMAETSVKYCLVLIGIMALWLGIMKIGEKGGAVNALAWIFGPFFRKIFPDVPKNHPAFGSILMNFTANMLGLDNAATPMGLKAMNDLQQINTKKNQASNTMIMFIVLNTSGLTLIPISILGYRAAAGASNPTDIMVPLLIATFFSSLAGLIVVAIKQRINLINRIVLAYLGAILIVIAGVLYWAINANPKELEVVTNFAGSSIIFTIIIGFFILALRKGLNLYETFLEGAVDGFKVAIKIIPYLVAILVGAGVFRASGAMDYIISGIEYLLAIFGINTDFVDALPVAFMKPLSGSGARGLMIETMETFRPDSFVGTLSCIFQGTTETTFFTIAVYFGAINIKKTRYALGAGLIADLAGIIAAIFIGYIFFY